MDWASLFTNPMSGSYISQLGAMLGGEGSVASGLNQLNQANFSSQNFNNMLKQMLAGGGKMSVDKDNFSLKAPSNAMAGMLGTGNLSSYTPSNQGLPTMKDRIGGAAPVADGGQGGGSQLANMGGLLQLLNPSVGQSDSYPDFDSADLVGLTPDMMAKALQMKMMNQELGQKRVSDLMKYLSDQQDYQIALAKLGDEKKPTLVKEYEYAVDNGFKGTIADWKTLDTPSSVSEWKEAVRGGYDGNYAQWKLEMAKAGGTHISIGEKAETARALGEVKQELDVTDPKLVTDVEKKYPLTDIGFNYAEQVDRLIKNYKLSPEQASKEVQKALVRQDLDMQIKQVHRDKTVKYEKGKGWFVDGKLVRRDPYATR